MHAVIPYTNIRCIYVHNIYIYIYMQVGRLLSMYVQMQIWILTCRCRRYSRQGIGTHMDTSRGLRIRMWIHILYAGV